MTDKNKKILLIAGGVLVAIVVIVIAVNSGGTRKATPIEQPVNTSNYDEKLKAANELSKVRGEGLFDVERAGYYEADSIIVDGDVVENPTVKEKREAQNTYDARMAAVNEQAQEAMANIGQLAGEKPLYDEEKIVYYKAKGITPKQAARAAAQAAQRSTLEPTAIQETDKEQRKRVYEESFMASTTHSQIDCVIHRTQEVASGQMVTLRTINDFMYGELTIPKNTILFAELNFNKNRALLSIGAVKINNRSYAISLKGYGEDGGEGIPISVSLVQKEVSKELGTTLVNQTQTLLREAGAVGAIAGDLAKSVTQSQRRESEQKITLIDKQKITFTPEY